MGSKVQFLKDNYGFHLLSAWLLEPYNLNHINHLSTLKKGLKSSLP